VCSLQTLLFHLHDIVPLVHVMLYNSMCISPQDRHLVFLPTADQPPLVNPSFSYSSLCSFVSGAAVFPGVVTFGSGLVSPAGAFSASSSPSQPHLYNWAIVEQSKIFWCQSDMNWNNLIQRFIYFIMNMTSPLRGGLSGRRLRRIRSQESLKMFRTKSTPYALSKYHSPQGYNLANKWI